MEDVFRRLNDRSINPEQNGGCSAAVVEEPKKTFIIIPITTAEFLHRATYINPDNKTISSSSALTMEGIQSVINFFNYASSKWALGCLVTAVVLNRTNIYARTRWNLNLSWKFRLIIRIIPILLFSVQFRDLLKSIHCQTAPIFQMPRQGNKTIENHEILMQNSSIPHKVSSVLLFKASYRDSCLAIGILPQDDLWQSESTSNRGTTPVNKTGSLSLLWPLFKTIAISQFVETFSCAVLGRQQAGEFGMSLFELSLAFIEAEAVALNLFDKESFKPKITERGKTKPHHERAQKPNNINTSLEVLFVAIISAMNHLSSHILAVFDQQAKFRLLNTGIWGLTYISSIMTGIVSSYLYDEPYFSIFRFPTVSIISFIPHILILVGIMGCSLIYTIALLLAALAPPMVEEYGENQNNSKWPIIQRLVRAHRNMQASLSFSSIQINLHMDFYTALVQTGISIMSIASQAAYLNESRGVSIKPQTWLEEERLQELEASGLPWLGPSFQPYDLHSRISNDLYDDVGLVPTKNRPTDSSKRSSNGYTREMIARTSGTESHLRNGSAGNRAGTIDRGRWYMAFELWVGSVRLLLGCYGSFHLWLMARVGIQRQPRWLLWMSRLPNNNPKITRPRRNPNNDPQDHVSQYLHGEFDLDKNRDLDIETEFRKKARRRRRNWTEADERELDAGLYKWWLDGGWWGDKDNSGNFVPPQKDQDEDTTSLFSFSTTSDDQGWESDSTHGNTNRTPTQGSPLVSRESTPLLDTTLNLNDLAQLLDPNIPEKRAEAEALAAHLSNDHIVTRSRFHEIQQHSRTKVLTSTLQRLPNLICSSDGKLTSEEECRILEHLIISRRSRMFSSHQKRQPDTWASNMDESGPKCVVCQTSPRCIIVWPCRCLSLCNDCRISLSMNDFAKCVCCRGDVVSFSRIFIP